MAEEPLPQSADLDVDAAALFEAAADPAANVASASGVMAALQTNGALPEANNITDGDDLPADMGARPPIGSGHAGSTAEHGERSPAASQAGMQSALPPYDGDSPDLLRWRAEMLLDEMMVGAVDASAGDQGGFFRQAPPASRAEWIKDAPSDAAPSTNGASNGVNHLPANGAVHASEYKDRYGGTPRRAPTPLPAKGANGASGRAAELSVDDPSHGSTGPGPSAVHGIVGASGASSAVVAGSADSTGSASSETGSPNHGFVLANGVRGGGAEAPQPPGRVGPQSNRASESPNDEPPIPPAPFRPPPSVVARNALRPQAQSQGAHGSAGQSSPKSFSSTDPYSAEALSPVDFGVSAAPDAPSSKAPNRIAARPESATHDIATPTAYSGNPTSPAAQPAPADVQESAARKLTAVEQRYPRSSTRPAATSRATGSHVDAYNVDNDVPELGPIRRNPSVINHGTVTGSMSVANRNSKYAALLPRSTPWDTHEMEREIAALSDELNRYLPPGHESSRRAHHLLDKAQAIFVADPQRSAEVDYYLAQVRAIVQRSRQTMQWSGLYRKRLTLYLAAWVVLSGIVVAASLVFGSALGDNISSTLGWAADGWAASNVIPGLLAVFGGALGSALGGLTNMRRYLANGIGFIDRKYSLRGLILPIMGLLAGALICGVISGLFWLGGVAMSSSWLLTLVPALLAFGLGFAQESIYGTRE